MEWAANRYSLTPAGVRRAFSMARLLVYFDAYWWTSCALPPEAGDPGDGVAFSF
jgi:hypothetical protein